MSARLTVVVPIGGAGARLRPLTERRPKPLVPLAGGTMLEHALAPLAGVAYDEIVFVVPPGQAAAMIERHVAAHGPARARFVVQPAPLGQADAVARACEGVSGALLVLFPDTIHDIDLGALAARGREPGAPDGILHVHAVADPARFGVAVVVDGRVARLVEKPAAFVSDLAVVGVYWLADASALAAACRAAGRHGDGEAYLATALQARIDAGARFEAAPVATWLDCGTLPDLVRTNGTLLATGRGLLARQPQADAGTLAAVGAAGGSSLAAPVWLAGDAVVDASAVGPGVHVGAGARIERSTVGPRVHVGAGATIADARVRDAIVGAGAQIVGASFEGGIVDDGSALVGGHARGADPR